MTVKIETVYDQSRECGDRKERGLYAVAGKLVRSCGMLPQRIDPCDCCGQTLKLTRGLQQVDVQRLFRDSRCTKLEAGGGEACRLCLIHRTGTGYLKTIGEKYYKSAGIFMEEAERQGVSQRLSQIPRDFVVGKSVILLAHPSVFVDMVPASQAQPAAPVLDDDAPAVRDLPLIEAEQADEGMVARDVAGIVCLFVAQRIEYITDGSETPAELERLVARGITPVKVVRVPRQH